MAAATTASAVATEPDSQIRIRVIDAKLPLVLETLATNAGLEARIDTPVARSPATITGALSGSSKAELRRIAESHDLALFIDGNIAWIDDINKRHSATIMSTRALAAQVYDMLVAEPVTDEGLVRQAQGTLQLTGTRAFVQLTTRRASSIIDTITAEATIVAPKVAESSLEPERIEEITAGEASDPISNEADTDERTTDEIALDETVLDETLLDASVPEESVPDKPALQERDQAQELVNSSAPQELEDPIVQPPAPTRRAIRSITDVPGFDTDYLD